MHVPSGESLHRLSLGDGTAIAMAKEDAGRARAVHHSYNRCEAVAAIARALRSALKCADACICCL